jgi:gamma-glutamyltranspeptidase/glutathione hydrolase
MYSGAWADDVVKTVSGLGGRLTKADLARYQPMWKTPTQVDYRGVTLYAPSGRDNAGLWALVALKTLEHTDLASLGHYGENADALELTVRTVRALDEEAWYWDAHTLDDSAAVEAHLQEGYTGPLWDRVRSQLSFTPQPQKGSHSYHVVACDAEGNVLSGTNTIEGLSFGDGIFVQGVPLNSAGRLTGYDTAPGERRVSPFSEHIVTKDGVVVGAAGAFGNSLYETELEVLLDMVDYGLAGPAIAASKRFGTFPYDPLTGMVDTSRNWLDPRVPQGLVQMEAMRGLQFLQDQTADSGFGTLVTIDRAREPHPAALPTQWNYPVSVDVYPRP